MNDRSQQGGAPRPPVVLVDDEGRAVGSAPLVDAHEGRGLKHRAFTLLVLDADGHLVLARRAPSKPLWPGAWDGTVASHPVEGESQTDAARRRAIEELAADVEPFELGAVDYRVDFEHESGRPFAENEHCAVLVARLAPGVELRPDPAEVDAVRTVRLESLLAASPAVWRTHCPGLPLALEVVRRSRTSLPTEFRRAFRALERPGAVGQLAAAIEELVPRGEWRVVAAER
ncbi:MAG: NUDIX domain-containing protein [Planctomycetota bacterium]